MKNDIYATLGNNNCEQQLLQLFSEIMWFKLKVVDLNKHQYFADVYLNILTYHIKQSTI